MVEKISNEHVLNMVGMERCLLVTIRRRQVQFVRHVVRKGGLEKLVLEGNIDGKRQRERQRLKYLDGMAFTAGCDAVDILQRACERAGFKQMVSNVRS